MTKEILILADPFDRHADHMVRKLHNQGVHAVRLDPADLLGKTILSMTCSVSVLQRLFTAENVRIDLNGLHAIWYRSASQPSLPEEMSDQMSRDIVVSETTSCALGLWHSLDCLWVPGPPLAIERAQYKVLQLTTARALGFDIPPSIVTNDPKVFLEFYREHNGKIVSKPVGAGLQRFAGNMFCRYTEVVSQRDLGYIDAIRYCPVIFQAYVPKLAELRVTIVGNQIFPAEIRSQETHRTRYDWRRYDLAHTVHLPHDLPAPVRERCVRLVYQLGLSYGAIDMVLTPDGRYVFLEINPAGQCQWIEEATGLPISDAICNLLIAGSEPDCKEAA